MEKGPPLSMVVRVPLTMPATFTSLFGRRPDKKRGTIAGRKQPDRRV